MQPNTFNFTLIAISETNEAATFKGWSQSRGCFVDSNLSIAKLQMINVLTESGYKVLEVLTHRATGKTYYQHHTEEGGWSNRPVEDYTTPISHDVAEALIPFSASRLVHVGDEE